MLVTVALMFPTLHIHIGTSQLIAVLGGDGFNCEKLIIKYKLIYK